MTIQKNDPRLTAYVLGELEAEEKALVEEALARSPELQAEADTIRETADWVEGCFRPGPEISLTPEQILEVENAGGGSPARGSLWPLLKIAAVLLLMVGLPAVLLIQLQQSREVPATVRDRLALNQPDQGVAQPADARSDAGQAEVRSTREPESASPPGAAGQETVAGPPVPPSNPGETGADPGERAAASVPPGTVTEQGRTVEMLTKSGRNEVRQIVKPDADISQVSPSAGERPPAEVTPPAPPPSPSPQVAAIQEFKVNPLPVNGRKALSLQAAQRSAPAVEFGVVGGAAPGESKGASVIDEFRMRVDRVVPPFHTEGYDRIVDSDFQRVTDNPLSTFSIDVDTASYANVRRFILQQGTLPPPDAVRIEELINYFNYEYPQPADGRPFSVNLEAASAPWKPEHRLVRIGLKGRDLVGERPASNLVFLLDVSGSMSPENKLPLLRRAMRLLVERLRPQDRVAIAVYAGASGLVLPSTPGNQKMIILDALEKLEAGGSTNGAAGIELAYAVAESNRIDGGVNRVILATDGDFNVGVTDRGSLTRLIEEKAKKGIFLSVLGFGMGNLKDSALEQLADKGNGNYGYIDTIHEARRLLVEQMDGTLVTIAKDVKIQVEFNPARVAAYRLIGYENRALANQDFNDDRKDAGEIGAGHTVTALYEIVPAGGTVPAAGVDPLKYQQAPRIAEDAIKSPELLTVKLRYKDPEGDTSRLIEAPFTDSGRSWSQASRDFQFAAAVAGFGMVLRESPHRGNATFGSILELARESGTLDAQGYRSEFLQIVEAALRSSGR